MPYVHVQAASESPFLESKLDAATGVLCILRLAPSTLDTLHGGCTPDNVKEHALRSAVQVCMYVGHLSDVLRSAATYLAASCMPN